MSTTGYDSLPLDQQISVLVEGRKPSEKQIEMAVYLIDAGVLSDAANAAAYIEAVREFNRMKREAAGEPEKRVPKAQQIIVALETLRDEAQAKQIDPDEAPLVTAYVTAVNDSISVAGRYV